MKDVDKKRVRSLLGDAKRASLAGDEQTEINIRKKLVDLDPANPKSLMQYGITCLMHERLTEVHQTIEALEKIPSAKQKYRELLVDYLVDSESLDELSDLLDKWFVLDPTANADAFALLMKAWVNLGHPTLLKKLKHHCGLSKVNFFRDAIALFYHLKTPTDIAWQDQKVSSDPNELFWYLNFVESLLDHGYYEAALETAVPFRQALIKAPNADPGLLKSLQETIAIGEYLLEHKSKPHELIHEDYSNDLLLSPPRTPGKIALVFTGLNGRAMVGNRILDFYLAQLGYQSVFFRDIKRVGFGKGVKSLGDSRKDTIAFMQRFCEEHQCSDPLIIGASIGTFGAVSHGIPMGASRFALFGPVTAAGDKSVLMSLGDLRIPAVLIRCKRAIPEGERRMQDFIAAAVQRLDIKVVFNEHDALDRSFAQTLDGYQGITQIAIPDAGSHNALRSTLAQGRLASILT